MTTPNDAYRIPPCADQCRSVLVRIMADRGIEVYATWAPPMFPSGYEPLDMDCPHGVLWFIEPTAEGRSALARMTPRGDDHAWLCPAQSGDECGCGTSTRGD